MDSEHRQELLTLVIIVFLIIMRLFVLYQHHKYSADNFIKTGSKIWRYLVKCFIAPFWKRMLNVLIASDKKTDSLANLIRDCDKDQCKQLESNISKIIESSFPGYQGLKYQFITRTVGQQGKDQYQEIRHFFINNWTRCPGHADTRKNSKSGCNHHVIVVGKMNKKAQIELFLVIE